MMLQRNYKIFKNDDDDDDDSGGGDKFRRQRRRRAEKDAKNVGASGGQGQRRMTLLEEPVETLRDEQTMDCMCQRGKLRMNCRGDYYCTTCNYNSNRRMDTEWEKESVAAALKRRQNGCGDFLPVVSQAAFARATRPLLPFPITTPTSRNESCNFSAAYERPDRMAKSARKNENNSSAARTPLIPFTNDGGGRESRTPLLEMRPSAGGGQNSNSVQNDSLKVCVQTVKRCQEQINQILLKKYPESSSISYICGLYCSLCKKFIDGDVLDTMERHETTDEQHLKIKEEAQAKEVDQLLKRLDDEYLDVTVDDLSKVETHSACESEKMSAAHDQQKINASSMATLYSDLTSSEEEEGDDEEKHDNDDNRSYCDSPPLKLQEIDYKRNRFEHGSHDSRDEDDSEEDDEDCRYDRTKSTRKFRRYR